MQLLDLGRQAGIRRVNIDREGNLAAVAKDSLKARADGEDIPGKRLPERNPAKHDRWRVIGAGKHQRKLLVQRHLLRVQKPYSRSGNVANLNGDGT
jgi:hypothetical protein